MTENDKYTVDAYIEAYQGLDGMGWLLWLFQDEIVVCKIKTRSHDTAETLKTYWLEHRMWF